MAILIDFKLIGPYNAKQIIINQNLNYQVNLSAHAIFLIWYERFLSKSLNEFEI